MTNDQFPMTNGGGHVERAIQGPYGDPHPQLVICHWDLVIPAIIREAVRE
jgi:hypothetical protein